MNLEFKPGETVFICGGNGSGKTTLLDIITGLRNRMAARFCLMVRFLMPRAAPLTANFSHRCLAVSTCSRGPMALARTSLRI